MKTATFERHVGNFEGAGDPEGLIWFCDCPSVSFYLCSDGTAICAKCKTESIGISHFAQPGAIEQVTYDEAQEWFGENGFSQDETFAVCECGNLTFHLLDGSVMCIGCKKQLEGLSCFAAPQAPNDERPSEFPA